MIDTLPPLPPATRGSLVDDWTNVYTTDQMREYARATRDQDAALVLPYLRTLSGFGGTLDQARALAARAVAEMEAMARPAA